MQKIIMLLVVGIFTVQFSQAQFGIQGGVVGVPGEAFPSADGEDKLGGATGYTFGIFSRNRLVPISFFSRDSTCLTKVGKTT